MRFVRKFAAAAALASTMVFAVAPHMAAHAADTGAQNYLLLEYATPASDKDAAYDFWRRQTHAPAMLRAPGVMAAQFYELAEAQNRPRQAGVDPAIPQPAKYLTVYTLKTADAAKSLSALRAIKSDAPATTASYDWLFRAITPVTAVTGPANTETGTPNTYKLFVFANSKPGEDDQFNKEYNTTHAPGVAVNRGFTDWQRFALDSAQLHPAPNNKYLALYTIRTTDLKGVYDDMRKRRLERPQSPDEVKAAKAAQAAQAYDYTNDYSETYKLTGETGAKPAP